MAMAGRWREGRTEGGIDTCRGREDWMKEEGGRQEGGRQRKKKIVVAREEEWSLRKG